MSYLLRFVNFQNAIIASLYRITIYTLCKISLFIRHHKNSIVIPGVQHLYAKHPCNSPSPQQERKMKESLQSVKSGSNIGSLAAVSPALLPYIGKKDSSDFEVLRIIFHVNISTFDC